MLRRLHLDQPESFAFTPDNLAWAEAQMTKYPPGRQASAVIALLWRAQEQEGWLSRPAIEYVAEMLDMPYIRALEVATFYFMFQLHPVGSVAHIQICGTTSCMICGSEDLMAVCEDKIAKEQLEVSGDGKFSWEEVECLGACSNAPMAQIGKDYYEDLTAERLGEIIDEMAAGKVPQPGSQIGRYASEPRDGLTSLKDYEKDRNAHNASVAIAKELNDTIKRIDGTEVPITTPWVESGVNAGSPPPQRRVEPKETPGPRPSHDQPADATGVTEQEAEGASRAKPRSATDPKGEKAAASDEPREARGGTPRSQEAADTAEDAPAEKPDTLDAPRGGEADDLKQIRGLGPQLESKLHEMGIFHFDQIASWSREHVAWIDNGLGARGRAERDDWVGQAKSLMKKS